MPLYTDRLLPHIVHWALRGPELADLRRKYLQGVSGTILEIGFGSGLNLPHYPPGVTRLHAVEPADEAWRMAREAIGAAPFPVERIGSTAEAIALPDASVDAVASTWTLCTIPDAGKALREVRRVLKPGGPFCFVEHGRSPEPRVARWQDRLTPLQRRLAGGCHLNREIDRLIEEAGLRLERIDRFYAPGPKIGTWLYAGKAGRDAARRGPL